MTEKRFTHEKWYNERKIKENGELFAIVDVYNQADKICNRLNELFNENEQLKQSLKNKMDSDNYWEQKATEKIKELEEENEQLKQELSKYREIHFRNENGTHTVLYEKKE